MAEHMDQEVSPHDDKALESRHMLMNAANSVGKFIEHWGFRSIHGRIWTVVFLSPRPVSTLEIIEKLEVSKGLVRLSVALMGVMS